MEQRDDQVQSHRWYARPVFLVADIQQSIDFYVNRLGFVKKWHEADGAGSVCQVDRSDCEIILSVEPARSGRSRLFVELTPEGLEQIVSETTERSVPTEKTWWGYDVIRITDPDGNELRCSAG